MVGRSAPPFSVNNRFASVASCEVVANVAVGFRSAGPGFEPWSARRNLLGNQTAEREHAAVNRQTCRPCSHHQRSNDAVFRLLHRARAACLYQRGDSSPPMPTTDRSWRSAGVHRATSCRAPRKAGPTLRRRSRRSRSGETSMPRSSPTSCSIRIRRCRTCLSAATRQQTSPPTSPHRSTELRARTAAIRLKSVARAAAWALRRR